MKTLNSIYYILINNDKKYTIFEMSRDTKERDKSHHHVKRWNNFDKVWLSEEDKEKIDKIVNEIFALYYKNLQTTEK